MNSRAGALRLSRLQLQSPCLLVGFPLSLETKVSVCDVKRELSVVFFGCPQHCLRSVFRLIGCERRTIQPLNSGASTS